MLNRASYLKLRATLEIRGLFRRDAVLLFHGRDDCLLRHDATILDTPQAALC